LVVFPSATEANTATSLEGEKRSESLTVQPVSTASEQLNYRFLVAPQNGFTSNLHDSAVKGATGNDEESPRQRLPVLLEGPYQEGAQTINFHSCRDILLVIGGSGISVGLSSIYKALSIHEISSVTMIWSVRKSELMRSVANEELQCALRDSRFTLKG
jgi:NAD(P)H-flavin reductase